MRLRKVFLSYRREGGADAARVVHDALVQRHFRVFMDVEDLRAGHFEKSILASIEACSDFVVVLTPGALDQCQEDGDWLRWEIAQAIALGKNIVPLMTEGFVAWPALPPDLAVLRSYQALVYSRYLHNASMDKLASWLRAPLLKRVSRALRVSALTLLALFLVLLVWDRLYPPGPMIWLVNQLTTGGSATNEWRFAQPFRVQFPGGVMERLTNGELFVSVQGRDASYLNAVRENGEVSFPGLPAAWKDEEARVSVSSRNWQLPEGTNTIRLSGETIVLNVVRRELVIQGWVGVAGSDVALANVAVSVAGITNVSDARGRFSLTVPGRLVRDSMTLVASRDGNQPFSRSITNLAEEQKVSLIAMPPPPPPPFTQGFVVHVAGGTNDLVTPGNVAVVLEFAGGSCREEVVAQGEATFENIPATMKDKDAKVSISARDWQLPKGTNVVRLTGQRITLAVDGKKIVVRGLVKAGDSGTPLAGALVTVAELTNATDKSGGFSVTVPGRLVGKPLPLAVSLNGYEPFSGMIAKPWEDQNVTLAAAPSPLPVATQPAEQPRSFPGPSQPALSPALAAGSPGMTQQTSSAPSERAQPTWIVSRPLENLLEDARVEKRNGRAKKADELSSKATSGYQLLAQTDFATYGPALAIAWLRRGELFAEDPGDRRAEQAYNEAKATCVKLGPANSSRVALAIAFNDHAVTLSELGDLRQNLRVLDAFHQAITLYSNAIPSAPDEALAGLANTYQNLGLHQAEVSDFANACPAYREAVLIYERLPPGQSPKTIVRRVRAQREFAGALLKLGQRDLALTNYLVAIQTCEQLSSASRLLYLEELVRVQSEYAAFLNQSSDLSRARLAYEQAIALYRQLENQGSWTNQMSFADTLNSYGVLLTKLDAKNNARLADLAYQEALPLSRAARDRKLELQVRSNQGVSLENQGKLAEARDKFNEALTIGNGYLEQRSVDIGASLAGLHLQLAELESWHYSPDRAERVAHLQAANKQLTYARKLTDKLPASPDKTRLEDRARALKVTIDTALKR